MSEQISQKVKGALNPSNEELIKQIQDEKSKNFKLNQYISNAQKEKNEFLIEIEKLNKELDNFNGFRYQVEIINDDIIKEKKAISEMKKELKFSKNRLKNLKSVKEILKKLTLKNPH